VKNDKLIRAVGRDDGPANAGQLCVRGRFGVVDVVHGLNRLRAPLVRRDGRLIEVSWDEALSTVAQQLSQYRSASPWEGDDQFGLIASAAASNEESYALQKFARTVMKSNNVALPTGYPEDNSASELACTLKSMDTTTIRDIRSADCIMCIGTNPFESHPILGLEILHALNTGWTDSDKAVSLINVDARQTRLAQEADMWLKPKMATDHVLLAGVIKALIDTAQITHRPEFAGLDLDEVAAKTDVGREAILEAAQLLTQHLATPKREGQPATVLVIYGSGVTHYPTAMHVIAAIRNLALVADQAFGAGKLGIIGVPGEGNFVGTHDLGLHPALLPGYRSVSSPEARSVFEAGWGTSLNPSPGLSYSGILEGIRAGQIQALYLAGEVPPLPEFANLKFLVVQGIVGTETMQHAHVVLPTTTFAEIDGTLTNLEGRVQRLRKAIAPIGDSRPAWMIARDLARYMGDAAWDIESPAAVMNEITALVPAYAGMSYDNLNADGITRRFAPEAEETQPYLPVKLDGNPQFASDQFPLTLITERNLYFYHGACLTEQVPGMNLIKQEETLYLNEADTRQLGVSDGDLIKVVSPHGSGECIVRVANWMLPERVAFASFNRMSSSALFPMKTPNAKAYAIRIEAET
jgi:predicted molibdopterin-dependent oxidoreductase YjgC